MVATRTWSETWGMALLLGIVIPVGAVAGVITYFSVTSVPLHPNPQDVKSVMDSVPAPNWADAADKGRQVVRAGISEQNLPGVSVAVGVEGQIVWAEGFGWANLESKAPVGPGTRFRIGHVSKALTSAAVGLLLEKGRLHLDEEIQTYVPAFPRKQWPVTLRQLMGHVAGIRHYWNTEWGDKPTVQCDRASDGVNRFASSPLLFQPEMYYRYSTYGWVLVSAAVEAAANAPFFDVMDAQIFKPLGMADTTADRATAADPGRVTSYYRQLERERSSNVDYSCFAGAGAFLSTPSDLVRFGMAIGQRSGADARLLKPATVSLLQASQQLTSGEDTAYGLGWMLDTIELAGERSRMVGHASRTIEGASTSFLTFPDRDLVVAVTANISFADPKSIALGIAQVFAAQRRIQ